MKESLSRMIFPKRGLDELSALFAPHEVVAGSDDEARSSYDVRWQLMHFT